jgi:hypothetical protein
MTQVPEQYTPPSEPDYRTEAFRAISRVIIWQTVISGFLAILIIGVSALIPIYNATNGASADVTLPDTIDNWGGIIIGFYFGSALTQMASLATSLTGNKT